MIGGEPLTRADALYLEMAADSVRKTPERLQDSLQKLAALAAALAGGGVVALRPDLMLVAFRALTVGLLLASAAAAALGAAPVSSNVSLNRIDQCRELVRRTTARKWFYLRVGLGAFFLAFGVAIVGLLVGPPPANPAP